MISPTGFDRLVAQLTALGFSRERAEASVRAKWGISAPDPDAERDERVLEKAEQAEIVKLFRAFGCKVRTLSQPRATKQTPGFPDLYVVHRGICRAWWWESKRQVGGRFSKAQLEFAQDCVVCCVHYGHGDRYAAQQYLIALGLAEQIGGVLEPTSNSSRSTT